MPTAGTSSSRHRAGTRTKTEVQSVFEAGAIVVTHLVYFAAGLLATAGWSRVPWFSLGIVVLFVAVSAL